MRIATVVVLLLSAFPVKVLNATPVRNITWQGRNHQQSARAIMSARVDDAHVIDNMLLRTPAGNQVIISSWVNAWDGTMRIRLTSDSTGWWMEVRTESGVSAPTLSEFFAKAGAVVQESTGHRIARELVTSDGLRYRQDDLVPYDEMKAYDAFVEGLRASGTAEQLRKNAPSSLREVVSFLQRAVISTSELVGYGYDLHAPAAVLWNVLEADPDYHYETDLWSESVTMANRVSLADPDDLQFVKGFRNISDPKQFWKELERSQSGN